MENLMNYVKEGQADEATKEVNKMLDEGINPQEILKKGLISGMDEVGKLFQEGEYFIPELLISARAMKKALEILKPSLIESGVKAEGKIILGTVKGDRHDIGKNLVGMMLEGAGFEIIDLGVDVPPEKFVEAVKEHYPIAIGLSALLTTTMLQMKNVIDALNSEKIRNNVKVLIGGAPVTQDYAAEIGADFYGDDPMVAKAFLLDILNKK